jgi:hypothetical protein
MPEGLAEVVGGLVETIDTYDTFVETYTTGMKEKAGEPFECEEEVPDPGTESGKRTLVEGKSTEEEVRHAALFASYGEAVKGHICEMVWSPFENTVTESASGLGSLSELAVDKAHEKMDGVVGGIFDDMRDKLFLQLKKGGGDTSHEMDTAQKEQVKEVQDMAKIETRNMRAWKIVWYASPCLRPPPRCRQEPLSFSRMMKTPATKRATTRSPTRLLMQFRSIRTICSRPCGTVPTPYLAQPLRRTVSFLL